jgi:hypothetical protein
MVFCFRPNFLCNSVKPPIKKFFHILQTKRCIVLCNKPFNLDRSEIPPIIIDFDDDESSNEKSWIQSNMITDWTGTPVVNDRLYITFLSIKFYLSSIIVYSIHKVFFVTRLIINKINKVQWVDFKLENVLVSLHSLKTMGIGSIIFKEDNRFTSQVDFKTVEWKSWGVLSYLIHFTSVQKCFIVYFLHF